MSEKETKKTKSQKLNSFLEKNRKFLLVFFVIVIVGLIAFVIVDSINKKNAAKDLTQVDLISYELTNGSSNLEEAELTKKIDSTLEALLPYTKKSGIAGVRANMLCAELNFSQKKYEQAAENWTNAIAKGKRSYTAPICYYQLGVCYEQLKDLDKASASYKNAAENPDFPLASHALFSYARIQETQQNYEEAILAYQTLFDTYTNDEWANLAKTRILTLQTQGKAE